MFRFFVKGVFPNAIVLSDIRADGGAHTIEPITFKDMVSKHDNRMANLLAVSAGMQPWATGSKVFSLSKVIVNHGGYLIRTLTSVKFSWILSSPLQRPRGYYGTGL